MRVKEYEVSAKVTSWFSVALVMSADHENAGFIQIAEGLDF